MPTLRCTHHRRLSGPWTDGRCTHGVYTLSMTSTTTTTKTIRVPFWVLDALTQEAQENCTTVSSLCATALTSYVQDLGYIEASE